MTVGMATPTTSRKQRRFHGTAEEFRLRGILWGWKQIGMYLGVSESTALRWHRIRPMPVLPYGGHVAIPKSALDLWFLRRGQEEGS